MGITSCLVAGIKCADSADAWGSASALLVSFNKTSEVGPDTGCFLMCLSKHVKY